MLSLASSGFSSPLFVAYLHGVRSGWGVTVPKAGRRRSRRSRRTTNTVGAVMSLYTPDVMMLAVLFVAKFAFPEV